MPYLKWIDKYPLCQCVCMCVYLCAWCRMQLTYSRRQNNVPDSVPQYGRKMVVFTLVFTIVFCTVLTKRPTPFTKTVKTVKLFYRFTDIFQLETLPQLYQQAKALYHPLNTTGIVQKNSYKNLTCFHKAADLSFDGHTAITKSVLCRSSVNY